MSILGFSFNGTDQALVDSFRRKGVQLLEVLIKRSNSLMIRLQAKIVTEKFASGPRPGFPLVGRVTSRLAGSVRAVPASVEGSSIVAGVEAGGGAAFYGKFLEDGTAPHEIVATNKKALAFMMGGKQVFAKFVQHPGTRAYHFMRDSLAEFTPEIQAQLQQTINQVLEL
jgi:hypothetical protein